MFTWLVRAIGRVLQSLVENCGIRFIKSRQLAISNTIDLYLV
jgi:hypothetical protein